MSPFFLIALATFLVFGFGVLCGTSWAGQILDARERRQAAVQRRLNEEWRVLRGYQEAAEEERRWASRQHPSDDQSVSKASSVVLEYTTPAAVRDHEWC